MQKVIQRTQQAQKIAVRRHAKAKEHLERGESWARNQERQRQRKWASALIKDARTHRQEDWAAGSLAPRRDVGDAADNYGALTMYNVQLPDADPEKRPKWFGIAEGDRVVVVKGREKGKIGAVKDMNKEKVSIQVENVNMHDVDIPDWVLQEEEMNAERRIQTVAKHIPFDWVKLVYPLPDPETGIFRDVMVDRLLCINRAYDKHKREWDDGERVIPGTNTIVPWPEKAEPRYEDNEDDTLRISVEEQTFRPFLLYPPMPLSVVDELRNKFSRFRTRHDHEFVAKREAEDARAEKRKELSKAMRTPLQELADLRARQKKEQERDLSDEQLARIGEVIAREREKATSAVSQFAR